MAAAEQMLFIKIGWHFAFEKNGMLPPPTAFYLQELQKTPTIQSSLLQIFQL